MTQAGLVRRENLLTNKHNIKPRFCVNSPTKFCICKNLEDCCVIECNEGSVEKEI